MARAPHSLPTPRPTPPHRRSSLSSPTTTRQSQPTCPPTPASSTGCGPLPSLCRCCLHPRAWRTPPASRRTHGPSGRCRRSGIGTVSSACMHTRCVCVGGGERGRAMHVFNLGQMVAPTPQFAAQAAGPYGTMGGMGTCQHGGALGQPAIGLGGLRRSPPAAAAPPPPPGPILPPLAACYARHAPPTSPHGCFMRCPSSSAAMACRLRCLHPPPHPPPHPPCRS